jgi:Rhodanese-like domain
MAKSRHNPQPPETSPRGMLAILAIGALLVAGLVVWALTRTVDTSDVPMASTTETTIQTATTASAVDTAPIPAPAVDTAPRGFNTPLAPTTAGLTTSSQAPVLAGSKAEVPRISAEDLREKVRAGSVTVVDVRANAAYQEGHIPGSLSIPLASVEANLDLLPKGKQVITYCT